MGVIFYIISLIILYFVIETAVRNGINRSKIGQFIEEQQEVQEHKQSREAKQTFLNNDLDD
ncbi:hypothetical protein GH741_12450 [Aquibacillus halophilus]|uniref:Uncharacterized protein n=1 Tax=Aquibacillus halophilus TaxID=930132 RepID=A0A6A8DI17_9BACI|nr:DUF6019 family protein [Aquibacillus halophilus]MRH43489.1 hypothetical protein [Aquibacillus halophilus]